LYSVTPKGCINPPAATVNSFVNTHLCCALPSDPASRRKPLRITNPSPPSGWVEDFHPRAIEHATPSGTNSSCSLRAASCAKCEPVGENDNISDLLNYLGYLAPQIATMSLSSNAVLTQTEEIMSDLSCDVNFHRSVKSNLSEQSDMLEKLLIELWRAVEITGNIQSEAKGVDESGFLHSVAKAERNLVEAISELIQTTVMTAHGTSLLTPLASQGAAPSPRSALPSPRG